MKKGKLIVIDGTDGSGKATQIERLHKRLKKEGVKVKKIDFPQYKTNYFGALLRECLDGKRGDFLKIDSRIASTLYAADRFESSERIKKWLEEGFTVLCDRYVTANQIHQGGKLKSDSDRKDFLKWLDKIEFDVFRIPRPDVIIYLHVPVEISQKLMEERASRENRKMDSVEVDLAHMRESQESALAIIKRTNKWVRIDCAPKGSMRSIDDIHEEIYSVYFSK